MYCTHSKLLEVEVEGADHRFRVVVPENADRFPTICHGSVLSYSPRVRTIKRLTDGHEAYIVPGVVGSEDRRLALELGVPLLGPDPQTASLYASKSGSKRIFASAGVNVPPGAHDIYDELELITALGKLICANIDVARWIVKIDDEHGGRGIAYLDAGDVEMVILLRKERRQTIEEGGHWSRTHVQEEASERLIRDLQTSLAKKIKLACKSAYSTWKKYLEAFERVGGTVEAAPKLVLGSPSVNLFIEPDGTVSATSTHQQLFSSTYVYGGATFPQRCVPNAALLGAGASVGKSLFDKGVIGHVGIDFVAFQDSRTKSLRLWAVDLNVRITSTAASFALFEFLMDGSFDLQSGDYWIDDISEFAMLREPAIGGGPDQVVPCRRDSALRSIESIGGRNVELRSNKR